MLTQYILKQLGSARYKLLEDGTYFGEIPRLQGVWASGSSLESCREELREVLESWLLLKLRSKDPIPGLKVQLRRLSHQYA
ncbi:TPA: HicB family protein [Candidatus Uhrbacteria bacterium]|nr:HicB family protein [Candidatus Uhrbacteria bacterium]